MNLPNKIKLALEDIYSKTSPVSIFLYGSQARGDATPKSDYKVGILYKAIEKIHRFDLQEMHSIENLNIYPFIYEDFIQYSLDSPFPEALYLRSLFDGGAFTLYGKKVVEETSPPAILTSDLLEEISFEIAYALGALLSFRKKDISTASDQFVKAIMYGSRLLIMLRKKKYVLRYDEIITNTVKLYIPDEYKDLILRTSKIRKGTNSLQLQDIYTGISYLNQVIRTEIKKMLGQGNDVVLEGVRKT
ncbi:hypothetical protein A3B46_02760 [Candidatus Roizmanbacteria bacterium RIFCSPLOWO2_01_FULL_39_19]|nr:MAG: hypothetical protein A3B46_02760 [Candidatus Roizmanbacteria bacterium RIFCSPLOWO2_01_FULL_39_19]